MLQLFWVTLYGTSNVILHDKHFLLLLYYYYFLVLKSNRIMLRIKAAHIHIILYFMHAVTVYIPHTPTLSHCSVWRPGLGYHFLSLCCLACRQCFSFCNETVWVSGSAKRVVWCELSLGFHSEFVVVYTDITESLWNTVMAVVQASYFEIVQLFCSYWACNYFLF
jgi:hypothetical protein